MIDITAIHLEGGVAHQHISEMKWRNTATLLEGHSTRSEMVAWLEKNPGQAVVRSPGRSVSVGVVRPKVGAPYVRTYADGVWTDNLLALLRY